VESIGQVFLLITLMMSPKQKVLVLQSMKLNKQDLFQDKNNDQHKGPRVKLASLIAILSHHKMLLRTNGCSHSNHAIPFLISWGGGLHDETKTFAWETRVKSRNGQAGSSRNIPNSYGGSIINICMPLGLNPHI